jgi:hypothetical protein
MSSKATFLLSFILLFLVNSRVSARVSDSPMSYGECASSVLADTVFIDQIHLERKQEQQQTIFHFKASRQFNSTIYLRRVDRGIVYSKPFTIVSGLNAIEIDMKAMPLGNYIVFIDQVMTQYGTTGFLVIK